MFEPDKEVLSVVRDWVNKAENDLKNAAHTLKLGAECPTDTVCFHAQQCVEKYIKALLVWRAIDFPKTHNLDSLIATLDVPDRPDLSPEEQARLTDYATVTRYPGDYEPIPLAEARRAVAIARRVRDQLRKRLSRGAWEATC
jgi:HEPN domain-containing protein